MRSTIFIAFIFSLCLISCSNEPSIQKYFVENSGKKDFIALDVSPSIINIDKSKLTPDQQTALSSFEKMNILIFKSNEKNGALYQSETQKLGAILKDDTYQELMKIGSGKDGASVSFVGDENDIDEFIFFAKNEDNGFAVVRILGNDMNPNNIMNMIGILQIANVDMAQLKPLQDLIK